jgi:predicted nucleotidyltransferase
MDAHEAARDFVTRRFPDARLAFLGGSTATGTATPTSDLDVFVLLPEAQDDVGYVETTTHGGWLVEAFVYGEAAAERWLERGREQRRPVLDSLIASGSALIESDLADAWAARSHDVLAAGPTTPDSSEIELRRYVVSGLVDDLDGATDRAEELVIMATAFREAGELVLLLERAWLGSGKWLVRNLRGVDDRGLVSWAEGARDGAELAAICRRVLDAAGGYLQDGYVRGERPSSSP